MWSNGILILLVFFLSGSEQRRSSIIRRPGDTRQLRRTMRKGVTVLNKIHSQKVFSMYSYSPSRRVHFFAAYEFYILF